MPEEGDPLFGRDAVLLRAAAQFGLAVQPTHQFGLSEHGHDLVRLGSNPISVFEFHGDNCTGGGGTSVGGGGKVGSWELGVRLCRECSTWNAQRTTFKNLFRCRSSVDRCVLSDQVLGQFARAE